ncbi:hypothetical protein Vretimale_17458 [Volvox reticuliferus]|uniref:Uncharacterized protein n=2 Tax=Volvox reticuliferus TaxID=1737510 RepID=A0A8J4LXU8_9CHLO|nr:hypothetical protein Vretimale_17458 [Volvox reticuliferus]
MALQLRLLLRCDVADKELASYPPPVLRPHSCSVRSSPVFDSQVHLANLAAGVQYAFGWLGRTARQNQTHLSRGGRRDGRKLHIVDWDEGNAALFQCLCEV